MQLVCLLCRQCITTLCVPPPRGTQHCRARGPAFPNVPPWSSFSFFSEYINFPFVMIFSVVMWYFENVLYDGLVFPLAVAQADAVDVFVFCVYVGGLNKGWWTLSLDVLAVSFLRCLHLEISWITGTPTNCVQRMCDDDDQNCVRTTIFGRGSLPPTLKQTF